MNLFLGFWGQNADIWHKDSSMSKNSKILVEIEFLHNNSTFRIVLGHTFGISRYFGAKNVSIIIKIVHLFKV